MWELWIIVIFLSFPPNSYYITAQDGRTDVMNSKESCIKMKDVYIEEVKKSHPLAYDIKGFQWRCNKLKDDQKS